MALTKITNSLVAINAIQGTLIADNAVTAVHIVNNAITATQLADNAVTATKIQNGIIAADHLAADLITATKIADDAISEEHLDVTVISSLSTVTANSSDYVMLGDTSDSNNLKKALVSDFGNTSEQIQDIAGAMFTSNTETGITATYEDGDGTIDLVVGTLNQDTTGTAATVTGAAQTAITSVGTLTALTIDKDSSGLALSIDNESTDTASFYMTSKYGMQIVQDISAGKAARFERNIAEAGSEALVEIINDHTSNTQPSLKIQHDGTGQAISMVSNGTILLNTPANGAYGYLNIKENGGGDVRFGKGSGNNYDAILGAWSNNDVVIYANSAEKMRIKANGNVGIGTTAPDALLSVTTTSSNVDLLYLKGGNSQADTYTGLAFEIGAGGNGPHGAVRCYTGPSAQDAYMSLLTTTDGGTLTKGLTQDHLGNVGIGTTSPAQALEVVESSNYMGIHIRGSSAPSLTFGRTTTTTAEWKVGVSGVNGNNFTISTGTGSGEKLVVDTSGNVGIGNTAPNEPLTIRSSGENVNCTLLEIGNDLHATNTKDAWMKFVCGAATQDNSWAIGAYPGSFRFSYLGTRGTAVTTAANEKMRINSDGLVIIGDQTNSFSSSYGLAISGSGFRQMYMYSSNLIFYNATNEASLSSAGAWTNASDIAYKKDIVDTVHGLEAVKKLQPRDYVIKADDTSTTGFIAQEIELVLPQFVIGKEGSKNVNYAQITAVLTKAIQELEARITAGGL